MTREQALESLRVAHGRSCGDIPVSEATAEALGLDVSVITKSEAAKLLGLDVGEETKEIKKVGAEKPKRSRKPAAKPTEAIKAAEGGEGAEAEGDSPDDESA